MIRNHIFDLYGTLVDIRTDESKPSLWRCMALTLSLQGAVYAPEELQKAYQEAVKAQVERRAAELPGIPKTHIEPDILPAFVSLFAQKGIDAGNEKAWNAALLFRTLSMRHIRLYPGALAVLYGLRQRGQRVYLLSNAQAVFTVPELRMLGLFSLFDGIVLSSDVGVKKPDKAIFERVLFEYGLRPETCLMIGNDEEADMLGAAAVGIAGRYIHTKQSPDRRYPLPDACREIRSLTELL